MWPSCAFGALGLGYRLPMTGSDDTLDAALQSLQEALSDLGFQPSGGDGPGPDLESTARRMAGGAVHPDILTWFRFAAGMVDDPIFVQHRALTADKALRRRQETLNERFDNAMDLAVRRTRTSSSSWDPLGDLDLMLIAVHVDGGFIGLTPTGPETQPKVVIVGPVDVYYGDFPLHLDTPEPDHIDRHEELPSLAEWISHLTEILTSGHVVALEHRDIPVYRSS